MGDLLQLAVYNPAILKDADFLTGFVARRETFDDILKRLHDVKPKSLAKHRLILGQRGMGKTSLLRRIAMAVRDDAELAGILLPLTFREEQYNVHNLHTFWVNCLDALGDHFERTEQHDKAADLDRHVAGLTRVKRGPASEDEGEEALAALKTWAKREGKRILLLIDNIDLILDGLAKQHWSLRRTLQEAGGIVVIGAATAYLEATADPKGAFYDFFQVTVLERLSQDELLACLRRLAEARGESGRKVCHILNTDPGRIRTLHDLTGGNLRTLVLLYMQLERDADDEVMHDLERLLDEVTVLYKARVEDLAPQARVVLDAVALNWNPVTAAELAEVTGMETAAVSTQLDRLVRNGIVEKTSISTTARVAYQLGERFFNIWYLMRHGPRRQRTRLRWLTAFLRSLYSPQQLIEKATVLLQRQDRVEQPMGHYYLALGDAVDDHDLRNLPGEEARRDLEKLPKLPDHAANLLRAFAALTRENFGDATAAFQEALGSSHPELYSTYFDDILRVLRLAAKKNYGDRLLAWFDESGLADRNWPLRAAFDAYLHGEARLNDVNPEVGNAARRIYQWLASVPTMPTAASPQSKSKGTSLNRKTK